MLLLGLFLGLHRYGERCEGGTPRGLTLRATLTLAELVHSRYLPHVQEYKRSWKTDETILRLHILPGLGPLYLDEVTPEGVAELVRRMRLKGYASGTTNRVVILLRYVFNLARKWKLVGVIENPTAALQLAPETHRDRFLTEEETKRLLVSIADDENRLAAQAVLLLLLTGARRNEITHARWEQIDWRRRTLLVPQSKSGKPRKITLNGQAIALLKGLKRTKGNPWIFPSPDTGSPPQSLYYPWHRIRCRAGLPDVRLHDLRHSFASFLVNQGVSIYVVQDLLGHTQIKTTQRYAHLTGEARQDAAEVASMVLQRACREEEAEEA
ncbi:tyrosine-type recombinase/integrase [Aurantimonas coralicida]|uniref:tyrosine-type recombinase/integrase n=1 Tax=Aurantimonas coralicida TaxID=182270 RepID=UPI001E3F2D01|nr:site-specific integrase [Aurantimonas coralicida]MCD1645501.1 site-specific integrase [Aurantimonas coralicida]